MSYNKKSSSLSAQILQDTINMDLRCYVYTCETKVYTGARAAGVLILWMGSTL